MRQDAAAIESLEPHARDVSRPMQQPTLEVKGLRVLKNSRTRRPLEYAPRAPLRERLLRCDVSVGLAPEFEAHDVVRTALVELILTRGADEVVRGSHHARWIADNFVIVHQRAERLDPFAEPAHFNASPASAIAIWRSEIAPNLTIFHPVWFTATTVSVPPPSISHLQGIL